MTIKGPFAIILGVALTVAMAVQQAVSLPNDLSSAIGVAVVILTSVYSYTPGGTAALIKAHISPHVIAAAVTILSAFAALLPNLPIGSVWHVVIGVAIAVGSVLLPGANVPEPEPVSAARTDLVTPSSSTHPPEDEVQHRHAPA